MSSPRGQHPRPDSCGDSIGETESDLSAILGVLEDRDCRSILEATTDDALTARELCDRCDFSSSTAYRKLDELQAVGLLEERIRLDAEGSHTSEYRFSMTDLEITLNGGTVEAKFSPLDETGSYPLTD